MFTLTMKMPDTALSALKKTPEEFAKEFRLAAAAMWYNTGFISQERAAEIAGLSRADFIASLSKYHVSPFQTTAEELEEEIERESKNLGL